MKLLRLMIVVGFVGFLGLIPVSFGATATGSSSVTFTIEVNVADLIEFNATKSTLVLGSTSLILPYTNSTAATLYANSAVGLQKYKFSVPSTPSIVSGAPTPYTMNLDFAISISSGGPTFNLTGATLDKTLAKADMHFDATNTSAMTIDVASTKKSNTYPAGTYTGNVILTVEYTP